MNGRRPAREYSQPSWRFRVRSPDQSIVPLDRHVANYLHDIHRSYLAPLSMECIGFDTFFLDLLTGIHFYSMFVFPVQLPRTSTCLLVPLLNRASLCVPLSAFPVGRWRTLCPNSACDVHGSDHWR